MGQLVGDTTRARSGSQQLQRNLQLNVDIINIVQDHASDVLSFLVAGLNERVFIEKGVDMIRIVFLFLDFDILMEKVVSVGASQVAVTTFRRFHQAAITIDPSSRDLEKSEEIRIQYREFLRRLEKYGRDSNIQKEW